MSEMEQHSLLYEGERSLALIRCNHKSCADCDIDWDHAVYVEGLKDSNKWWEVSTVSSMARMIYHTSDGHGDKDKNFYKTKAHLVCDFSTGFRVAESFEGAVHKEAITAAKLAGKLSKVVVVVYMNEHFRLLVFDIENKRVRLVDGLDRDSKKFKVSSKSPISEYTRTWFEVFSEPFGGGAGDYRWVWESYLKQGDRCNCGPIAVLALHHELAGTSMVGEEKGSYFLREYRPLVVEKFVDMFKALYRSKSLLERKSDGKGGTVTGVWQYFDPSESYRPSAVPETPERITALTAEVTPEVQAGPLLGSHGGASGEHLAASGEHFDGDPKATSEVKVGSTGAAKALQSRGRAEREPSSSVDTAASPALDSSARDRKGEPPSHVTGSSAEGSGNDSAVSVPRVELSENEQRLNEAFAAVCTSLTKRKIASVVLRDIFKLVCAVAKEKDEFSYLCSVATLNDVPNTGADFALDTPARVSIQTPDVRKAIKAAAENWHRQKFEDAKKCEAAAFGESVYQEFNVGRKFLAVAKADEKLLPEGVGRRDVPLTHPEHWFWKSIDSRICENATMWRMKKYNRDWHRLNQSGSIPPGLVTAAWFADYSNDRPAGAAASGSDAQGTITVTPRRRLFKDLETKAVGLPNKRPRTRSKVDPVAVDMSDSESEESNEREGDRVASGTSSPSRSSTRGADRPSSDSVAGADGFGGKSAAGPPGGDDVYDKLRDLLYDVGAKQTFERLLKCAEPKELRLTAGKTQRLYILLQSALRDPSESGRPNCDI